MKSNVGGRMFERHLRPESGKTQEGDERLAALLQEWKGVEPQSNFESCVWRRIRAASALEQRPLPALTVLRDWFVPRTAWANAMAAAAGIIVGVGLALSTPAMRDGHQTNEPLLHSQTLTGSYLTMVTGGTR